ncbi:polysaccharide deacetylase family protein [Cohnella lubricantis]|uniref:Polysaccharide deacetylase family protein n=2 Tax=Cohnella lubricantis TaxID=2163172 RepID=A0A841TA23_9BACL|nr:polysaccharide deacetylase family protein [Cohnella lubricantis]
MLINNVPTNRKQVAFTFDDGPDPIYTPQILDIFREAGGRATFFMVGSQIDKSPEVARRVQEQGHEIGNHTYTHPRLIDLSEADREEELLRTHRSIESLTGAAPRTFRPPYLAYDEQVELAARKLGYAAIGAVNSEARDWDQPGVDHILQATRAEANPGAILLFHDGFGDRSQTVEAVRRLVSELTEQGYSLVTVSELLASGSEARQFG